MCSFILGPVYPGKRKRNLKDCASSVDSSMDAIDCGMPTIYRPSSSDRLTSCSATGSADSTSAANMTK